ncbi:MAG: NTPase [Dehalococcoidales bacterium]|nr:NTPase [Dehalococcoidales bacterium]
MQSVYLLTGRPGTGKTSLIKQVVTDLKVRAGGFYTEEIRSHGERLGFKLVTLDGKAATLAHIDFKSAQRVSRYGVDIEALERVGVVALKQAATGCELVVVDEIGKMELLSSDFRETIRQIIDSGKRVLGTIMLSSNPWADEIKHQAQVKLVTVTRENHQEILAGLRLWLSDKE